MCKPPSTTSTEAKTTSKKFASKAVARKSASTHENDSTTAASPTRLLLTTKSFEMEDVDGSTPSMSSACLTVVTQVAALFAVEHLIRYGLDCWYAAAAAATATASSTTSVSASSSLVVELFQKQSNRYSLARHAGVDALCAALLVGHGMSNRHILAELWNGFWGKKAPERAGFENRCFQYHGAAFQLLVLFTTYQVKNLYDTIIWGDGPEFIVSAKHNATHIHTVLLHQVPKKPIN